MSVHGTCAVVSFRPRGLARDCLGLPHALRVLGEARIYTQLVYLSGLGAQDA